MNDNIDKNEIRRAIDRLQAEHPCGIAYDPTAFVNMETVNTIKRCVDKIARRMMEDTEINIICEFAKLYLEGVRPTILPKQEWIPVEKRLPNTNGIYIVTRIIEAHFIVDASYFDGSNTWYADNRINHSRDYLKDIVAWMPLPEPYKAGDPDAQR